jgi:quinol monooxygenase YgiN
LAPLDTAAVTARHTGTTTDVPPSHNPEEKNMKVSMVASHYPHPSHHEEFVARVQQVRSVFRQAPGCLAADCWVSADGKAVVSTVQWESEEARDASFASLRAAGLDTDYDERETRPREIVQLVAC